jgi:hypothetical protein
MNRPPEDTPQLWIEYHCGWCYDSVEPSVDGFECTTCHVRWSVDATDGTTSWPEEGYVAQPKEETP